MKQRVIYLDYLRVLACLMVILVHASEYYYIYTGMTIHNVTDLNCVAFVDGFCHVCVPLFFLISGYLLTPLAEDVDFKKYIWKRFKRVMIPLFVFEFLYSSLPLLWGGIDGITARKGISHMFLNFPEHTGHLWFCWVIFGLYLFLPVISAWLRTTTKNAERWFLAAWLAASCIPMLALFTGKLWGDCDWNRFGMLYSFNGYIGYFVLGHYLKTHFSWSRTARIWGGLALYLVFGLITALSFRLQAVPGEPFPPTLEMGWDFVSPNIILATFGMFVFFSAFFKREPGQETGPCDRLFLDISANSYGMYLMHIFFLDMFKGIFDPILPTPAAIPVMAICTFICSYLVTKLISMIPGGHYAVG